MKRTDKIKTLKAINKGKLSISVFREPVTHRFYNPEPGFYKYEGDQLTALQYEQKITEILKNPKDKIITHVAQQGNEPLNPLYNE